MKERRRKPPFSCSCQVGAPIQNSLKPTGLEATGFEGGLATPPFVVF